MRIVKEGVMRSELKVSLAVVAATLAQGACFAGAAHAAAETEMFTVNGAATGNFFSDVLSSSFSQFNPALGTLNSITFSASGTATFTDTFSEPLDSANFEGISSLAEPNTRLVAGAGSQTGSSGTFDISASGTETGELAPFEGASTTSVYFSFEVTGGTLFVDDVPGTVTYNYTPAVASGPEPVGWSVFATGLATPIALRLRRRTAG
jgi:hypothetical protein